MAREIQISQLPSISEIGNDDVFIIETNNTTYKINASAFLDYINDNLDADDYIKNTEKGIANGVVPLNSDIKIDSEYLNFGKSEGTVFDGLSGNALSNLLSSHVSDIYNPHKVTKEQIGLGSVENKTPTDILSELTAQNISDALGYVPGTGSNVVTAVKGDAETEYQTGNVNITPAKIGLGKVDNTSDSEKSVLSASKLTTSAGSSSIPVYFNNGIPVVCGYNLNNLVSSSLNGKTYDDLTSFVSDTASSVNHANIFRFKDSSGWTPQTGWWRCFVSYQNSYSSTATYSVGGNVILFGDNINMCCIGHIGGNHTDSSVGTLSVSWENLNPDIISSSEPSFQLKNGYWIKPV